MSIDSRAVLRSVGWAATWGVGVAIGVALGGWLTLVGGAGAPGGGSLDLTQDVLVLPALAGGTVIVVHLVGQGLIAMWRRRSPRVPYSPDEEPEPAEDERV
jgi:hypothetical protein